MHHSKERAPKYERLEARVASTQKALFQYAAQLSGKTLTDFAISALQEVSERIIQTHQIMTLSKQDQEIFIEAIFHPSKPNKSLRDASKRFKKIVKINKDHHD